MPLKKMQKNCFEDPKISVRDLHLIENIIHIYTITFGYPKPSN